MGTGSVESFISLLGTPMRLKLIGVVIGMLALSGCAVHVDPYMAPVYSGPVVVHRPYVYPYYRTYSPHYQRWRHNQIRRGRGYCC